MLVSLKTILTKAHRGRYAVGAFNINNLEIAQAIIRAADKKRSPVILQTSEGAIDYAGMEYLAAIVWMAAEQTSVPVVFHLDHGKNPALVERAIKSGFYTSVMIDGSAHPYKKNVQITKKIVSMAHRRGITVEAELGAIAGIEDFVSVSDRDAHLTDPEEAKKFVKETKCDALAVAIGTSHGVYKYKGKSKLDIERLKKIKSSVKIPLVLHGASNIDPHTREAMKKYCDLLDDCDRVAGARGVSDTLIKKAVSGGINKINIDSDLRLAFTESIRKTLVTNKKTVDPRKFLGPARDAIQEVVEKKMQLFGCAGKAAT